MSEPLAAWLADEALVPVWQRLRGPLERDVRATRIHGLTRESRHALGALLRRPVTGDVRVVLADLEGLVGRPLVEVVELATGPLRDRAAERSARDPRWRCWPRSTRRGPRQCGAAAS